MKKNLILIMFSFIFSAGQFYAQDTLWLMNGKKVIIKEHRLLSSEALDVPVIEYVNLKDCLRHIDADEVFKIDSAGTEVFYYHMNPAEPVNATVDQVRSYVKGQAEVHKNENPRWVFAGGVAIGFGSAFIAPVSLSINAFENFMYAPLIPGGYAIAMNTVAPKADKIKKKYPQYADDEFFITGYQDGLKRKKGRYAILGAAIGLISGLTFVALTEY